MENVMLTQSMLRKYEMYLTTIMLLFRPQNLERSTKVAVEPSPMSWQIKQ